MILVPFRIIFCFVLFIMMLVENWDFCTLHWSENNIFYLCCVKRKLYYLSFSIFQLFTTRSSFKLKEAFQFRMKISSLPLIVNCLLSSRFLKENNWKKYQLFLICVTFSLQTRFTKMLQHIISACVKVRGNVCVNVSGWERGREREKEREREMMMIHIR